MSAHAKKDWPTERLSAPLLDHIRRRLATEDSADLAAAASAARRAAGLVADDAVLARWEHDLAAELHGAGPLEPLLELPGVTDVLVNGPDDVFVDCGNGLERAPVSFESDGAVRVLACRLAVGAGRRLDDAQPFVDAHLADGTRLHAILAPVAEQTTISLRVLARRRLDLVDLVAAGTLKPELSEVLRAILLARLAFLISGGTGTGKTTVLGAMLGLVPPDERIVIIEDAAEITTTHPHVVRLLARAANVEGAGAVDLRELVRQSLRMRPDRVIVGEFRGGEVVELLAAMNTGHAGGGATVHANGVLDVPARLDALGALGGLDRPTLRVQAAAALDVVVHLERDASGLRQVAELGCVARAEDSESVGSHAARASDHHAAESRGMEGVEGYAIAPVWSREAGLGAGAPWLAARLHRAGVLRPSLLGGPR